jgi:hypothetical protein
MTGALPPYPRDFAHWGRQHGGGVSPLQTSCANARKKCRRRPKTPPVPYGPADGATVPELSEELPLYVPARLVETPQPAAQAWAYGDVR